MTYSNEVFFNSKNINIFFNNDPNFYHVIKRSIKVNKSVYVANRAYRFC